MNRTLQICIRMTIVSLVLTGVFYPYVVTVFAQILFPAQANGTLLTDKDGKVIGSELIAQPFRNPAYFQPRPSAAGEKGYDATSSGGSNFGVTSKKLQQRLAAAVKQLREQNPNAPGDVPIELVTTSGSGLDPHLSPNAAHWQAPRIAHARGTDLQRIHGIIDSRIEGRQIGLLGEPRVNVLLLNLALDQEFGPPYTRAQRGG